MPADVMISLDREDGYFACSPSYRVEVAEDGTVRFVGRHNVGVVGIDADQIETDEVLALLEHAADIGFWMIELEDDVEVTDGVECGSDAEMIRTTISVDGLHHRVARYTGCASTSVREAAISLENHIEDVLLARWRLPPEAWECKG